MRLVLEFILAYLEIVIKTVYQLKYMNYIPALNLDFNND